MTYAVQVWQWFDNATKEIEKEHLEGMIKPPIGFYLPLKDFSGLKRFLKARPNLSAVASKVPVNLKVRIRFEPSNYCHDHKFRNQRLVSSLSHTLVFLLLININYRDVS